VKVYRGMGSLEAMMESPASRERYGQEEVSADKLVPQGVKGYVDSRGDVWKVVFQLLGG